LDEDYPATKSTEEHGKIKAIARECSVFFCVEEAPMIRLTVMLPAKVVHRTAVLISMWV
jgi:hypothetical protein